MPNRAAAPRPRSRRPASGRSLRSDVPPGTEGPVFAPIRFRSTPWRAAGGAMGCVGNVGADGESTIAGNGKYVQQLFAVPDCRHGLLRPRDAVEVLDEASSI